MRIKTTIGVVAKTGVRVELDCTSNPPIDRKDLQELTLKQFLDKYSPNWSKVLQELTLKQFLDKYSPNWSKDVLHDASDFGPYNIECEILLDDDQMTNLANKYIGMVENES